MNKSKLFYLISCTLFFAQSTSAQQTSTEEFNQIFPPTKEVLAAINVVSTIIPAKNPSSKAIKASYLSKLKQRAIACVQLASTEEVKSHEILSENVKLKECLIKQDEQILELIGMSLVSFRANQSPLRSLSSLGSQLSIQNPLGMEIYTGTIASKANVAVLISTRGEYISYELPSGRKIADLPKMPNASLWSVKISPNGRITALLNSGLTFIDNKTGQELWKARDSNDFYAWLPGINAALISRREGLDTKLILLDFKTGEILPYSIPYTNSSWALNISESPSRLLLATNGGFNLIENIRTKNGIQSKVIQSYPLTKAIQDGVPISMMNGKTIIYTSALESEGNALTIFDLQSGREVQFDPGKFFDKNSFAKISENNLLLRSYDNETNKSKLWALNVAKSTYQLVEMPEFWGILYRSENRSGFMIRDNKGMWFVDRLKLGKALPIPPIGGIPLPPKVEIIEKSD